MTDDAGLADDVARVPDLRFREATSADAPAVVELVESAYRGDASRDGWTTEADLLDGQRTDLRGITEIVQDPSSVLLLAELDTDLLACCELRIVGENAYFGTFAVRPALQGRGTGRAVLARADAEAVTRFGAKALEMTVIAQRADLIAWYVRQGFEPTGERRPFPYGDPRFGVPRVEGLEFVVLRRPTGSPSARRGERS